MMKDDLSDQILALFLFAQVVWEGGGRIIFEP